MRALRTPLLIGILLLAGCNSPYPPATGSGSQACTMEAKICPDGSAVGRVGPSCEFAECPAQNSSSAGHSSSAQTSSAGMTSVSDGTLTFAYNPGTYGLAVSAEQMPASSYIPPCETGFSYCLYHNDSTYTGTNFEAAGLGITQRPDLSGEGRCLHTQPEGYSDMEPAVSEYSNYATSLFAPLGDAGMGHFAHDRLYRLSVGSACYEFRTRVGQTQFANYEPGTVKEFTAADEQKVQAQLDALLGDIKLKSGAAIQFPPTPSQAM